MLRRIASRTLREPVLRPPSPGPQPASAAAAATSATVLSYQYQLLQQSRGLVSSVLLSSTRDAYESKKMAELKAELKSRGLASSGRKDDLIKRLVDHDSYINGSTANMDSAPGARPQLRKKSTLASLRNNDAGGKKDGSAPPAPASQSGHTTLKGTPPAPTAPESKGPTIDAETARAVAEAGKPLGSMKESETPANLEAGAVHNAAADGLAGDTTAKASPSQAEEGPAKKTTPPGLPPQKAPPAKETFNIQIPYYPDPPVPGAEIPVVTSYTSPHLRQSVDHTESSPFVPKAISVSASSAISHASDMADHASSDADAKPKGVLSEILADLQASSGSSSAKGSAKGTESALSGINKSVDAAKSAFSSVVSSATAGFESASSSSSSSSSSSNSSSSSRKSANRPLNEQERTGAYVLAGIVAGGFVLGGLGKPGKSKSKDHDHEHASDAAPAQDSKATVVNKVVPVAAVPRGDGGASKSESKPSGSSIQAPAGSKTLAPIMCVPKGTQLSSSSATGDIAAEAASTLARLAQLSTCEVSRSLS
ncbi:conserved hypothetical protein [Sporisorium reilianum SRZ2]|uniref:SAP domain-containing protein n=1 Tax=Sporisorium reilianum (strain SRZ2) TaxID=999809 RepID=E6ZZH3_SPORE|nr:conserved hypothetical protein [Sporisorium reilianum SRZ2]